jgi:hypothetical protein
MSIVYKLTNEIMQTGLSRNAKLTQWEIGIKQETNGKGDLGGPGWLHAYTHPLLAVLFNPVHANFKNPRLFVAEGDIQKTDNGQKVGLTSLVLIKEIDLPKISLTQKIAFGIFCAKEVSKSKEWIAWADKWLSGEDRSYESARKAWQNAADAYADAYADAADAHAACAACTAYAAYAAYAAHAAHAYAAKLHLISLAEKAMTY